MFLPKPFYCLIVVFLVFYSCKKNEKKEIVVLQPSAIQYAKGFSLYKKEDFTLLSIKNPFSEEDNAEHFVLAKTKLVLPDSLKTYTKITIPIERVVLTSTTHIPMLEALEETDKLVGFPNTEYISSTLTRKRIENGHITDLGKEEHINLELLINLAPDALIAFAMKNGNAVISNVKKSGIQVLLNNDWLEETPLGRAEWIKFFGALFDKSKMADSIFSQIETDYLKAKRIAKNAKTKPTILAGVMFKDTWNLPAGDSFVAQFLKDANTNYLWNNTSGTGSLQFSFETVYDKGHNADFWLAPGHYNSQSQLLEANDQYQNFKAFTNNKVYSFTLKKGPTGGTVYYEYAPLNPHIVLQDIIKITHPELLTDYQPQFLQKLPE